MPTQESSTQPKRKIRRIVINTTEELQQFLENYSIGLGADWCSGMAELFTISYAEEFTEVQVTINQSLLPRTYTQDSAAWARQVKKQCPYPYVKGRKPYRSGVVVLRASTEEKNPIFRQDLIQKLQTTGFASFHKASVPSYYWKNPWHVLNRIKHLFPNTHKPWVSLHSNDQLIYEVNIPKPKSNAKS